MIKAANVTKKFGDFAAISELNCEIQKGCVYGMIGSNGAGKSTFLRLISGVYRADGGEITVDGENVYENPSVKSKIAYVPDELYFPGNPSMNRMAALYRSCYADFDEIRFKTLVEQFGLNPRVGVGTFSKGMRRQAATILALSTNPDYIFFDETFDGLDPAMRNFVKNRIAQDVIERGTTAILTSHSLRELEDTCDQLALLHKGGIIFESDVGDLQTSLFKVQISLKEEYDDSAFSELKIREFSKMGSVAHFIVQGDREQTRQILLKKNPQLLDILPLSLEEVFIHEMQACGYSFNEVMEAEDTAVKAKGEEKSDV